ncbi:MAG: AMP-binding protein [Pseudomonadales bacterium]|nr:AMP-binding protein [Pseudomonadales bacterium]
MHIIPISRVVAYWAEIQPDAIALVHEDEKLDWKTLEQTTNQLARAYQALGVNQNDFVTIALPNGVEFFQASLAAWKLGATPQPVSAKLPKFELDQLIELAAPGLVVGVADEDYPNVTSVPVGYTKTVIKDHVLSAEQLPEATADSLKAMTSGGSTGRPKLIVSSIPAVWDIDGEMLEIHQQGAMLIPGPMYHNGPFMWGMSALFKGNTVVVTTRFDAEQTLSIIEQYRIDVVYMVPTMMQRIWKLPEDIRTKYDMSSLRALWHLASPCPEWLKDRFIEWLGADVIWELYGGTEGIGSTIINGTEWLAHRGSVGKPDESCEMKIVGENGERLPPNEIGELYMRPASGPGSTYRYVGADAKMLGDGWESLGDLGRIDEDGYLYLADRNTDMILSGGANIYPAEIEAAIDGYGPVRSSAVIGLPDEEMGNMVHAIVDAPGGISEQELLDYLKERLVRYKIPRTIEFVTQPLRDDAGKSRRKQLREDRL